MGAGTPSNRHSSTRRAFLGTLGATLTGISGCVASESDPEPTGRKISVDWRLDPESTGRYEHFRTLRDEEREWTWFQGSFVATESKVTGFEYELTFRHEGEVIDRWRSDFEPAEYSSLFVMEPGEGTTYEYPVREETIPTSFDVFVKQLKKNEGTTNGG